VVVPACDNTGLAERLTAVRGWRRPLSQAADLENQRNESSGMVGGAEAAGHLSNATREFNHRDLVDVINSAA
jgi:hypothetical protein